jgi:hypothetical protein
MPFSPILTKLFQEVKDPSYIIRLLDYLVNTHYDRTEFIIGGYKAIPLITGVLKNTKTNQHYYSLAQFYNSVTNNDVKENNFEILNLIHVTKKYSLLRILCSLTEDTILGFFDQKFRSFLLYRSVGKMIQKLDLTHPEGTITVSWNKCDYELYPNRVVCEKNKKVFELLNAFEGRKLGDLYYVQSKDKKCLLNCS